jgi:chromate transport protein ChrA
LIKGFSRVKNNLEITEVFKLFLRLGFTAYGGPVAHVSIMHNEVVKKRKWISEQHFLDLIGATNLIPGPNSTEMAVIGLAVLISSLLNINEIYLMFGAGIFAVLLAS